MQAAESVKRDMKERCVMKLDGQVRLGLNYSD